MSRASGCSTRSADDLVKAMGMSGISKSEVSRRVGEIDARVQAFLTRPIVLRRLSAHQGHLMRLHQDERRLAH